jgi:ferredoxin--NADP+ reductase
MLQILHWQGPYKKAVATATTFKEPGVPPGRRRFHRSQRSENANAMSAFNEERVLSVHHWTNRLFTFTTTRDQSLRFSNGHFTMIGLKVNGKPLVRAYSIVSANYEDHLEFLSIKVPDGPLTSRLQHIQVGDTVIVGRKPTGTLVVDYLLPGKRLYLLSTGTGLAPFMSIIRDPDTYEKFEQVVLVHGVRQVDELAYHDLLVEHLPQHEVLGELVSSKLRYYPTVTRETYRTMGRVTELIESGKLFQDLGAPPLAPESDRVMICGSPGMLRDLKQMLEQRGFKEGNTTRPGDFVIERAFAEQ